MTYNIHPIFVHFPIALLFIYSIIKILPLSKWVPSASWKHIERVFLLVGVLGAFVANSTGEIAEHLVKPNRQLVEMHASFASAATWIYGLLLLGEILYLITPLLISKLGSSPVIKIILFIQKILLNKTISILLAISGLIAISITGLLGGTIVYGVTADPVASIVLKILGIRV
jgi:uncharacterized membrane protein